MGCSRCRFFFKMKEEGGVYPSLGKEVNGVGVFIVALQSTSSKIKSPATTAACSCWRRRGHGAPGPRAGAGLGALPARRPSARRGPGFIRAHLSEFAL